MNYRGTRFWHTAIWKMMLEQWIIWQNAILREWNRQVSWLLHQLVLRWRVPKRHLAVPVENFSANGLNEGSEKMKGLPSGKRLHNYGKSPFSSWIYPLKIVIFHSYVSVPEGTQTWQTWIDWQFSIKFDDLSLEMPIEFRDFPAGHVWLRRAGWWDRKMPSESGNFIGMGSMIQCVTMMGKSEKPFKEVLVDHPK